MVSCFCCYNLTFPSHTFALNGVDTHKEFTTKLFLEKAVKIHLQLGGTGVWTAGFSKHLNLEVISIRFLKDEQM